MQHKVRMNEVNMGIVGFGPKGLYTLAELLKHLLKSQIKGANIYLFEKSGNFGTGPIYKKGQADYLLMNYENTHIDHSQLYLSKDKQKDYNHFANPKDLFSSRSEVGKYLSDLYKDLKSQAKGQVNIHELSQEVKGINKQGGKFTIEVEGKDNVPINFDYIMLSTGHNTCRPYSKNNKACIDFVYPIEVKFKEILKNDVVVVKGLGLTFIDAILGLTEGRKGRFVREGSSLKYIKSGLEPRKIIPYSRSGSLMLPRKNTMIPGDFTLKSDLLKNISGNGHLDFEEDLIPALEDEFALQGGKGSFVEALEIDSFGIDELISIAESKQHPEILLASLIWRKFATDFNRLYKNRGLTPASQSTFDKHWKGKFQKLCYGPPLINFKKLQAINKAGLIDLRFSKDPEINFDQRSIDRKSEKDSIIFDHHIDARIPSNDIRKHPSALIEQMLSSGLIRIAKNGEDEIGCIDINENGNVISASGEVISRMSIYGMPSEGLTYNNDSLSHMHNNYASHWVSQIIKDLENEHDQIDTDHSLVDGINNKAATFTSVLS